MRRNQRCGIIKGGGIYCANKSQQGIWSFEGNYNRDKQNEREGNAQHQRDVFHEGSSYGKK